MRHRLCVVEDKAIARDFYEACRGKCAETELHGRILRVHRNYAINAELIIVNVRREGANCGGPHAIVSLGHGVVLAVNLADHDDFPGVGRAEAQRDGVVRIHLRRYHCGSTSAAATTGRRNGSLSISAEWHQRQKENAETKSAAHPTPLNSKFSSAHAWL